LQDDLSTHDPYDIWKTRLGYWVKKNFYKHNFFFFPAAFLSLFDHLVNNRKRWFYLKQEYPIVRAFAVLSLLNLHIQNPSKKRIDYIEKHLKWLSLNNCNGYHGYGWGLNFKWPINENIIYNENTPLSTCTPYILEAFVKYRSVTNSKRYDKLIKKIYAFFELDIVVIERSPSRIATSYAPMKDRVVTNSISYTMYSYALLLRFFPEKRVYIESKIQLLFNFIVTNQNVDGSWFYAPNDNNSFIDCFHSCIIIKNLIKTNKIVALNNIDEMVHKGYQYIIKEFYDPEYRLYKRFSIKNKPSLLRFDLYDNAEVLNLAIMLNDNKTINELLNSIESNFIRNEDVFSAIDLFGKRRNKHMLRWAIMPYLYGLSQLNA
jgi:hypothetical protein